MRRVRITFLAGDGSDVHDAPVLFSQHLRDDGSAAVVRAKQIHFNHLPPVVWWNLPRRRREARNTGVVHQDVDAAKMLERGVGGGLDGIRVGDVHHGGVDLTARFQTCCGFSQSRCVHVPQAAGRAGVEQPLHDCVANAACAAGDDGLPSAEINLVHALCFWSLPSPGSIQNQQTAPARPMIAATLIPQVQPSLAMTHGVTIGASNPIPLPPVFMMAAAVPPRFAPSSTAVVQKAPSQNPNTPRERVNHSTIQNGCVAKMPNISNTALAAIPIRGTNDRPVARPNNRSAESVSHPPSGMQTAIARFGSPA